MSILSQLVDELKKLIPRERIAFDPATLDDPVALKTGWDPLKGGGTNIRTHALRISDEGVYSFRPTVGFIFFCSFFSLIGLGVLGLMAHMIVQGREPLFPAVFLTFLLGGAFSAVGVCLLIFQAKPVVFDKKTGRSWRGWREPREDFEHGLEKTSLLCQLDSVHALQIVSERVRTKNSSYLSYELNLVMMDGSRINVVDHHDIKQIRKEAAQLGEYLEAAVWDTTG